MRARLIALVAVIVALLAPASVAIASEPYDLAVSTDLAAVYPVADGYRDSTLITVEVAGGAPGQRIRGAVTIRVGTRLVKTVLLSSAGHKEFRWNGRDAAGRVVTGRATLTLRVDGQAPVTNTVVVSAKRIVTHAVTRVEQASDGIWCWDAVGPWQAASSHDFDTFCPITYGTPIPDYAYMRMRGTKTEGGLMYIGRFWDVHDVLRKSVYPVKVTVTGTFTQTGHGTSSMWILPSEDDIDFTPRSNPVRTFSKSSTVSVTGTSTLDYVSTFQPEWMVYVPPTVDLKIAKFTIKVTYYVLE